MLFIIHPFCCLSYTQHRLDRSTVYNLESDELTHHGKSIYDLDSDEDVTRTVGVDSEGTKRNFHLPALRN